MDPGPCLYIIPKFYWDIISRRCLPFTYGGCKGGPNRFSTESECEEVCGFNNPNTNEVAPDDVDDCSEYVEECATIACENGVQRTRTLGGCEQCSCVEVDQDCSTYQEECAALHCEYSVQRTRTPSGCERCTCVQVEVDCATLQKECDTTKCQYGISKYVSEDGCTRCTCLKHPCANKNCAPGKRVATRYKVSVTDEMQYTADCRTVNKPGECPPLNLLRALTERNCRRECNDDADCLGVGKCCVRGCSQLCMEPTPATTSAPTNIYNPGVPQAPQPSEEREPEVRASEGGVATLRCLFHGNPPPLITWRRNEITINGDVGRYRLLSDGALEIVSLYRNDSGVYICIANNELGSATQEVTLHVDDPVEGPAGVANIPNEEIFGDLGQPLRIRCLVYGYPTPTIYWYRGLNGPMVPYSSSLYEARDNVLLIRKLNEETIGEYACHAYNGIGSSAIWPFVVQASRPDGSVEIPKHVTQLEVPVTTPQIQTQASTTPAPENQVPLYAVPVTTRINAERTQVVAGSEIRLACDVDGYPEPRVQWTKDRMQLTATDRIQITETRLTIFRAQSNDSGEYSCEAANEYTSHSSVINVTVKDSAASPAWKPDSWKLKKRS
ncbi:papilin-like isoform X2 [Leptidea sinapis]|uniref:papilin-like isoform X2 n=1 Tax=Leptidea sinapis TaxID=189913 RepID=UPI0021C29061|nr:papilin-like isoform X2 [Leptidea sinapis]